MDALVKTDVAPTGFRPVAETLPQVIERLARALNPQKIILFGSYAYGQPTPDSDVDLLVVWETDLPPRQRVLAVSRLLYPHSLRLVFTPSKAPRNTSKPCCSFGQRPFPKPMTCPRSTRCVNRTAS